MTFLINNLSDLTSAADALINLADHVKLITFRGDMGAGKTTFIKEICARLGVVDVVSSPTFSLVNEYLTDRGATVYHFDFYRIKSQQEAFDMGYEEYFYSGNYCLIEWPEKVEELIPDNHINVEITIIGPTARSITMEKF